MQLKTFNRIGYFVLRNLISLAYQLVHQQAKTQPVSVLH